MYFILVSKQKSYTLFTFKSRMQDQNGRHFRGLLGRTEACRGAVRQTTVSWLLCNRVHDARCMDV